MAKRIKELWPYILILVFIILIKCFVVTPIRVNGPSMEPTLYQGDIMILNKTAYYFQEPKRFDIIVVETSEDYLIKRIIGLPNEKIEYKNNKLYVDGKEVEEPLHNGETFDFSVSEFDVEKIPQGQYLVMGDNREHSYDGRELGFVKKEQLLGRTSLTILPFKRIGFKN